MRQQFNVGDTLNLRMWFQNDSQEYADPTAVECRVTTPDGVTATFTYPDDVVKTATGKYHLAYTPDQVGLHTYWAIGTGAVAVVEPKSFVVLPGAP